MAINLFACGDIVNFTSKQAFIDKNLRNIISDCDFALCNFEAPIKTENMCPIKKAGPHLYQSNESISYLKKAGFNITSLANNHIYDYGQNALSATIEELRNNKIEFVGGGESFEEAYQVKIIEKNDIKICLLAGCENEFGCLFEKQNRGGYAWIFHDQIEDNIREWKQKVDFVVLIVHAGVEDIQFPIKEWRDKYRRFSDIGVDVIIGHHPHVPQGYEKYNKSVIFYSLGNFYFDTASFENKTNDSYSVILKFYKDIKTDFEIIYHKMVESQTKLVNKNDVSFNLEYLNSLLGDGYKQRNDEISLKLFNNYYSDYYKMALGRIINKFGTINLIKSFIRRILFSKKERKNRSLLLLHNIRIDTHRFVVQRALSLISEKESK
jgi:poly-gamma-glutamate synthesis protein (capsule biosynthesis protein)